MLTGGPTCSPDFAIVSLGFSFVRVSNESKKDIIERGVRPDARFEFG
jgi:hypothetical protein